MTSLLVVKFLCCFVVFLRCGWAQDFLNHTRVEVVHVPSGGLPSSPTVPTEASSKRLGRIRIRRATTDYMVTSSCLTPAQPINGEYKLDRYFCDDIADCEVAAGTSLEPGSQLVYRCNSGYKLKGHVDVYCRSRGRWSAIPECVEVKCDSLNSESTSVTCTRFGKWVNCDSAVLPETRAEVTCRRGYKKDTDFISSRRSVVDCNIKGNWEPRPIRCVPVCGLAITHQQPLVFGGTVAKIGDFPWHASIFLEKRTSSGISKVFICGGTIIQTNLVLTAAHCVYDERTKTPENPGKLFVITGNIFRDYESPAHNPEVVRKASVKNVYTFCNYYGLTGNYVSDIALLELHKPLEFSSILLPACLDDSGFGDQFLEPGVFGKVAGFGRTETGTTSGILQTLTVPYISYSQCRISHQAAENEAFISSDKFCAGYNNGSAVCEGDSGGGLVFKKGDLWYVMGIVSVGLGVDLDNGEKTCDKYSYSLYTKVSAYMTWIQDVLFYLERNEAYPSCNRDSHTSMVTSTVTSGPITTPSVKPPVSTGSSCSAPPQPVNGEWKLHRDFCKGNMDCSISAGSALEIGSRLVYRCASQFVIEGSTEVQCLIGGQLTSIPTCKGDSCSLTDGSPGSCTLLKNCQSELEALSVGKSPNKVCGFSGFEPIVCCPMTMFGSPTDETENPEGDGRGVIAKRKCVEYSQYVNNATCAPSPSLGPLTPDDNAPLGSIGKIRAEAMEFPHMVAVGFKPSKDELVWACGGTLISETFVLTAATCTTSRQIGPAVKVRLGDLNLENSDNGAMPQERDIIERIIHPEFKPPVGYHNIALLRLASPVPFNDWIRPACLYTAPRVKTKDAVATGWGSPDLASSGSPDLLKVRLPLVDLKTCEESWNSSVGRKLPKGIVDEWLICAGARGRDTCQGDSGGPLAIRTTGTGKKLCMYDVIGITSIGKSCGTGTPSLYTRIYYYIPWIESIVWVKG